MPLQRNIQSYNFLLTVVDILDVCPFLWQSQFIVTVTLVTLGGVNPVGLEPELVLRSNVPTFRGLETVEHWKVRNIWVGPPPMFFVSKFVIISLFYLLCFPHCYNASTHLIYRVVRKVLAEPNQFVLLHLVLLHFFFRDVKTWQCSWETLIQPTAGLKKSWADWELVQSMKIARCWHTSGIKLQDNTIQIQFAFPIEHSDNRNIPTQQIWSSTISCQRRNMDTLLLSKN